jgi:uncharacterized protein (DUF1800 family)
MPPTTPPPIDTVDPARAWQPWEPSPKEPFNLKWAGHLFRRAGLGASLADLRAAVEKGLDATLTRLMEGDEGAAARLQLLLNVGDKMVSDDKPDELRGWWCYCMIHTAQPLREKLTLFWHNHFATSINKVGRPTLMYAQNKLLRQHALGQFRPFLLAVSRDPAMIVWLDNNNNQKGKPNENYAREVMELFSLGVGNYTEKDVQEAARAFTGWHTNESGDAYEFNARQHDDGPKTLLGKTGNWNGDDVVRILCDQPQAARFLVRKLYRYFVSETHDPPAALLEPLAESFRKSDYDIAALLKTMLRSRHFFSEYAYRQRVKSPAEFVLGAARAVAHPTDEQDSVRLPPGPLVGRMAAMGQELFAPPNVKGWPHGKAWLNTATVLARNNFARRVAFGQVAEEVYDEALGPDFAPFLGKERPGLNVGDALRQQEGGDLPEPQPVYDPADLVRQANLSEPAKVVDFLLDLFLQGDVPPPARAKLVAFVGEGKPKDKALDRRVREAAHTIMCMPEYQLA